MFYFKELFFLELLSRLLLLKLELKENELVVSIRTIRGLADFRPLWLMVISFQGIDAPFENLIQLDIEQIDPAKGTVEQ